MTLLSGEVETEIEKALTESASGMFRMTLLSGEVETELKLYGR